MVRIGHARVNEAGEYWGGSKGDQTGQEVCITPWYSRPWNVVIRAKSAEMAGKIAEDMERGCKNDCIGYSMGTRNSCLAEARKVGYDLEKVAAKCNADCSSLVMVCCCYAGVKEADLYKDGNSFVTANMVDRLKKTGLFSVYKANKYTQSPDYLQRGDILVYEGHHTAVVLDNGDKVQPAAVKPSEQDRPGADGGKAGGAEIDTAEKFYKGLAGVYKVKTPLYLRRGAGKDKAAIRVMAAGERVRNYGYYTDRGGGVWLLVETSRGETGFCSERYTSKVS